MNNVHMGIVAAVFATILVSLGVNDAYAQELSYNEKLEFAMKLEQIIGHMISALDNITDKEWQLAKMHLIHPMGEHHHITNMLYSDAVCAKKLELALDLLQYTDPQIDKKLVEQRFAYVFEILKDCKQNVIGSERKNLNFNLELIELLLEQSQQEFQYSQILVGKSKAMEIQDSIGLVIRAQMLVSENEFLGTKGYEKISGKFDELFQVYSSNPTMSKLITADNAIIDEIELCIEESLELFDGQFERNQEFENKPSLILKTTEYSNNNVLVELEGINFIADKKLRIEYHSPNSDHEKILNVITGDNGGFSSAIEFVQNASNEPYVFSIAIDDIILHEALSIS